MSIPPLASVDDLSDRVGGIASTREMQAAAFMRAASAVVRAKAGRTWLDDEGALIDVPEEVRMVVVEVAARVWANPDGAVRESVSEYSVAHAERAGFYVEDDELELINGGPAAALSSVRVEAPCLPTRSDGFYCSESDDDEDDVGS